MNNIAEITDGKKGIKKVKFNHSVIYDILKEKFGFRFYKYNNKGYYLKYEDGIYKVSSFHRIKDTFWTYVENDFDILSFNIPIGRHEFIEEYYKQLPLKECNLLKSILKKDFVLTDEYRHPFLLEIDFKYRKDFNKKEMLEFLQNAGFIETTDTVGNFHKDCPLFYKKIASNKYLVFNIFLCKNMNSETIFDFWKLPVKSEKEFLLKKYYNPIAIILGFNLKSDIELYENEFNGIKLH